MSTGCEHNEDHSRSMDEYDWVITIFQKYFFRRLLRKT